MLQRLFIGGVLAASALVPAASAQVELANLREDVRGLSQRVADLTLRVEELSRENADLRRKASTDGARSAVTMAQLNDAIAELNQKIKSSVDGSQAETLQIVRAQMLKLGEATNAALDAIAKAQTVRPVTTTPAAAPVTATPIPEGATTYVVQKGESLASIAKKTGVKQQDLAAANKIADPSVIFVGQTLVIPRAK